MNDLALQKRIALDEPLPGPQGEEATDFQSYWRAVMKRRWAILGLVVPGVKRALG